MDDPSSTDDLEAHGWSQMEACMDQLLFKYFISLPMENPWTKTENNTMTNVIVTKIPL